MGLLLGIYLLALVPRLLIVILAGPQLLETWEYDDIGRGIAGGHGYSIIHWGRVLYAFGDGNLYSFLTGALYFVVGYKPMLLAIAQAAIASMAAPVVFAIGKRALSVPAAVLAASLTALHPGLLVYSLKLHPLGLDVLLLALLVFWLSRLGARPRDGVAAGIAMGLSLMSRPTFFVAGLVAALVGWRHRVLPLAVALSIGLAVATPWIGRNWLVLGRPAFITTGFEDVWKGNNPMATGSSHLASGQDIFSVMPTRMRTQLEAANEIDFNDVFGLDVLTFVRDQPVRFLGLFAQKLYFFWWFSPQSGLLYQSAWLSEYQIYYATMLGFAIVGGVAIVRTGPPEARRLLGLLIAIGMTIAVIHALSYVEGRHRWGIEPLLLLMTAQGLVVSGHYLRRAARVSQMNIQTRKPTSRAE